MEKLSVSDTPVRDVVRTKGFETGSESPSQSTLLDDARLPKWQLISLCISISFGLFLSLLDTTIVAAGLLTIGEDFGAVESINWIALAYTLSYLGCAVFFARIADIVGRRNAYITALVIFLAFSLGCGFAQTLEQLIALRVMQGIGGSGLYSLTFVILPEISPPEMSQIVGAAAGAVVAMSGILGPVLGGVITHYTTWRWIFWINAPIGIIPLIAFTIAWPKPHQMLHAQRRSWRQLDIIGAILVIAASVCVVFSFQQAGITGYSWNKPLFLVPNIIGILCYVLLFSWEVIVAKHWPGSLATMFPLDLIKRRVYMGYVAVTLLGGFPYFMVIYTLPLRLQLVNEKSQLVAGLALLPMVGAVAIFSTVAAILNTKKNLIFETLLVGGLFSVLGTALLSTLKNIPEVEPKMYGFQVFIGIGFGMMVSTTSLGGGLECELKDTTVAQGIIAQVRVLGGSIGIAASTAILGSTLRKLAREQGFTRSSRTIRESPAQATPTALSFLKQVNAEAFTESMQVCSAITGLGVLATLLVWRNNRMGYMERRKEQVENDKELRRSEMEVVEG